ncbi:Ribonuclease HIII [Chlamydiales bacterium STE3]|nr:Ribonuclease HIII [Chlamydiales bacterium STE3]
MSKPSSFVAQIDPGLATKLRHDLESQGFIFSIPPYTHFSATKKGIACTLYTSGKLVVQGKEMASFIEFYLEPEILKAFSYSYPLTQIDKLPRIGVDESGKGDFFGPLCVAGVYASEEKVSLLKELGVKDSKNLKDLAIHKIALKIRENFVYHIVKVNPLKYNQLYEQFRNLNRLLAWGHATIIETLVARTSCDKVIIDQFASEYVVIDALKRKKIFLNLTQRHRAEEDLVVAAASILARDAFLQGLNALSEKYHITLPKGASSQVISAGVKFAREHGQQELENVGKKHFKTLDVILAKARE